MLTTVDKFDFELVSYDKKTEIQYSIEGNKISIRPQSKVNFVLGFIGEPFRYPRRAPLWTTNWIVSGGLLIHEGDKGWIGVSCQFCNDKDAYETAEIFNIDEDWVDETEGHYYHIRARGNKQSVGEWFSFSVSSHELMKSVGWEDLINRLVTLRIGIVGDVESEGVMTFTFRNLKLEAKLIWEQGGARI